MEAQLVERERIARELHDTVLQGAYGLILRFQAVADRLPPSDPNRGTIEDTLSRAERVIAEGRLRVDGLRTQSDDGSGLQAALAGVGRECVSPNNTEVRVFTEGRAQPLHAIVRDEVYWIAREAIVNALKSACAAKVEVELSYRVADLRVFIRDDGRGFEPAVIDAGTRNGHWGIRGMKERARRIGATVDIWTAVGAGTEVSLRIPASVAYRDRRFHLLAGGENGPCDSAPGRMTPITVLTVDDHPLLREGIAAVLENHSDLRMVGQAASGHEALERCRELRPDIVLMDLQMPEMSGIDAIIAIRSELPQTRVIVLTAHGTDEQILRGLNAGAAGYLLKDGLRKELVDTIRRVHAGHRGISSAVAQRIVQRQAGESLTEREFDVLMGAAAGKANKMIANKLLISEETVKSHMRSILPNFGANDRTHAVAIAVKSGMIDL